MSEEKKRNWFVRHKIITGILAVFLIAGLGSAMGGTTTTTNTGTDSPGTAEEAPAEPEPKKLSSQEIYDKVKTGMTKAEVIKIAGHEPDNCIESEDDFAGKSSTCSYGTLSLIFINGELQSKTKL